MATFHRDGWTHNPEEDRYFLKAEANGDIVHCDKCPEGFYPMLLMKWKGSSYQVSKKIEIMVGALKTEQEAVEMMKQSESNLVEKAKELMTDYLEGYQANPAPMVEKKRGRPRKED